MVDRGLQANIGAHGEPPLGFNYHAEMLFAQAGGLTNYEVSAHLRRSMTLLTTVVNQVLRAATRSGALSLGLFESIGSISLGKLADFLVYPPTSNILEDLSLSGTFSTLSREVASGMRQVWLKFGQ